MKPYAGLGIWVWEGSAVNPESLCAELVANHFAWLAIKVHDGPSPFNTGGIVKTYRALCHKHGLRFGVWGYLTGGDPVAEARVGASACHQTGADFYIADAEVGYEHSANTSADFCSEFRKELPTLPAALSSFGRIDFHHIAWADWAGHDFDFMPQAYACESTELEPSLCVKTAERVWPRERIYVTLGSYAGALGVLSGSQLYDSVKGLPLPGVNVWDAQELHAGQLQALGHLVKGTPPPAPKPPSHHLSPMFPLHPKRPLKLTTPLTRGEDVKDLQKAINLWHQRRLNTPETQEDGQFGEATKHAAGAVAFSEGLVDTSCSVDTIRKIWHPWMRTAAEIKRSGVREREAKKHAKGLAAMPQIAAHYIGVRENPAGSNTGSPEPNGFEAHFGMHGVPWCGCFAGSVILLAGGHVTSRVAYCPSIEADAKTGSNGFDAWTIDQAHAGPGWLALYCFSGSGVPEHVGVVESLNTTGPVTIEGNTGGTQPADGGMVAREQRLHGEVVGFARPRL